jgi:predicted permease
MNTHPVPERCIRSLLRVTPTDFREAHGADVVQLFRDLYREALRTGGTGAALRIWAHTIWGLIVCALAGRWEQRMRRGKGEPPSPWKPTLSPKRRAPRAAVDGLKLDLRFAFRTLRRSPGFTLAAVLILGVGIGATTTIFSLVDTVVLRRLPYPDPEELVFLDWGYHTVPAFIEWRDNVGSFSAIGGVRYGEADMTEGGMPERLETVHVTEGYLPVLGAEAHVGRLFVADDFAGTPSTVLLGHGLWQRRFGSDPSIVGRSIHLSDRSVVVVGVVDPGFNLPSSGASRQVDVWLPLDENSPEFQNSRNRMLDVIARLDEGVSRETAQAQMDALMPRIAQAYPDQYGRRDGSLKTVQLLPLRQATVRRVRGVLYVALGAVGLLLLIACANAASLFLARGTARNREVALRAALGAGRARLISQLLTEGSVVALAGGALGVAMAFLGVDLLSRYDPGQIPRMENLAVDTRILLFAVVASVGAGILSSIFPALQAVRRDFSEGLRESSVNATVGRGGRRFRNGLLVTEIALTLILLTGSGLLFRSLVGLVMVDPGFQPESLVTISLSLDGETSSQGGTYTAETRVQFVRELRERLEGLPGVRRVAAGWTTPFQQTGVGRCCWGEDFFPEEGGEEDSASQWGLVYPITEGYFEVLRAPLEHGREFTSTDLTSDLPVVILNTPLARRLYGRTDVVGERIRVGEDNLLTVIGVVEGVHHFGLDQGVVPGVYVPYERWGPRAPLLSAVVRTEGGVEALATGIREAVWAIDADLPVEQIVTMRQRVDRSLAAPRFLSILFGFFAGVALLLACGGTYGSMLYAVGQRRREMGIRLALGADKRRVIRLVLWQGMSLTLLGLGLGLAGAWGLTRLLHSILWGISATDPSTFGAVTLLLATVAGAACLVPAWGASRTDPLKTLGAE